MIATKITGRNGREASVHARYSAAADQQEPALCCPVRYSRDLGMHLSQPGPICCGLMILWYGVGPICMACCRSR